MIGVLGVRHRAPKHGGSTLRAPILLLSKRKVAASAELFNTSNKYPLPRTSETALNLKSIHCKQNTDSFAGTRFASSIMAVANSSYFCFVSDFAPRLGICIPWIRLFPPQRKKIEIRCSSNHKVRLLAPASITVRRGKIIKVRSVQSST